jgi:hypothetical protein
VPGAPTIAQAFFDAGTGLTTVSWNAPTSNGGAAITGYLVYFNGDSFTPNSIVNATTYEFDESTTGSSAQVSAVNSVGEGPKSAPVTVVEA